MSDISKSPEGDQRAAYQIKVQGGLDEGWSEWFDGMAIQQGGGETPVTALTGTDVDQAALHGILQKIRDLNLPLISVIRIDVGSGVDS